MITPANLYNFLGKKGVSFFTGVPDSLLKHFLRYIQDNAGEKDHIITANEGLAVGLAAGYQVSTGNLPLVYLQNSGLGNIINPLTSLADKEMYAVPMLLLIGWRGRPGTSDEPQHRKMGRITKELLDVLEVPVFILENTETTAFETIGKAIDEAWKTMAPVALLVAEDIFETYKGSAETEDYPLVREEVIAKLINAMNGEETVICTTGKSGREFYELNNAAGKKISRYLLSAGAMGHANHFALGIDRVPGNKTIVLDGDGALLMHLGALPTLAHHLSPGFIHIVINNGSHESVGGQPTEGFFSNLSAIANACGYGHSFCIKNEAELDQWLTAFGHKKVSQFVEIRTSRKSRPDLGRPSGDPVTWKEDFIKAFRKK